MKERNPSCTLDDTFVTSCQIVKLCIMSLCRCETCSWPVCSSRQLESSTQQKTQVRLKTRYHVLYHMHTWSYILVQVLLSHISYSPTDDNGVKIVAVDLQLMAPISGVIQIHGDITKVGPVWFRRSWLFLRLLLDFLWWVCSLLDLSCHSAGIPLALKLCTGVTSSVTDLFNFLWLYIASSPGYSSQLFNVSMRKVGDKITWH